MEPDSPGSPGFDWDEANVEHIARHGIEWWEAEEVLADTRNLRVDAHQVEGPRRYAVVGETASGRLLLVIFERRETKVRVITVRSPDAWQVRHYRRRT